jgi:hypothetical protein
MKAYLRFRVPLQVARSLSSKLATAFGISDRFTSNDENHLHIVLADLEAIDPDQIPVLNDAVTHAYLQFREHPPTIKLERFGIGRNFSRTFLIMKANIDPFGVWADARANVRKHMGLESDGRIKREWEPFVNLGELKDEKDFPKNLTDTYVWQANKVELVLKTKSADLILPWNFN